MKLVKRSVFFAMTLFAAVGCAGSVSEEQTGASSDPIVGGHDATEAYSFIVSLQTSSGGHVCGGSLVAPQWVVTAQHCIELANPARVRIGSNNKSSGGEVIAIDQKIGFLAGGYVGGGDDIALLKLKSPSTKTPVKMAESAPATGTATRLIGWGDVSWPPSTKPTILQEIDLSVDNSSECPTGSNMEAGVCISGSRNESACHGDSGGPALVKSGDEWILVGATSGVGDENEPHCGGHSAYSGVGQHVAWIREHIGQ